MFEEDEHGDLLVAPTEPVDGEVELDAIEASEPEPEPEIMRVKTLREMLYEQTPRGESPSPSIRRLQEHRVNRVLTTVADWMLGVVEQRIGDEMTLVVLLELAETVRQQIVWPERDAHEALVALAREAQELEQ